MIGDRHGSAGTKSLALTPNENPFKQVSGF